MSHPVFPLSRNTQAAAEKARADQQYAEQRLKALQTDLDATRIEARARPTCPPAGASHQSGRCTLCHLSPACEAACTPEVWAGCALRLWLFRVPLCIAVAL